jgi:hypothetical protein
MVKNAAAGDGKTDVIHKVKLWDKVRALELLAKHFALLVERTEHREMRAKSIEQDRAGKTS